MGQKFEFECDGPGCNEQSSDPYGDKWVQGSESVVVEKYSSSTPKDDAHRLIITLVTQSFCSSKCYLAKLKECIDKWEAGR